MWPLHAISSGKETKEMQSLLEAYDDLKLAMANKENLLLPEEETDEDKRKGENAIANFMMLAGEPLTWVEKRELWNNMVKTNESKWPRFVETLKRLEWLASKSSNVMDESARTVDSLAGSDKSADKNDPTGGETGSIDVETISNISSDSENDDLDISSDCDADKTVSSPEDLVDVELGSQSMTKLGNDELICIAKGIKEAYSIRSSEDSSELKFVACTLAFLWAAVASLVISSKYTSNVGSFTYVVAAEAFILFAIELVWECFLSWVVLRTDIKINYTRKLGNLIKLPKYFIADLLPFYESSALSMCAALAINQTLFCAMYYRGSRERVPFFSYVFLSQDRREDRPDTLTFQVTEDLMRFMIYIPFKLFVANAVGQPLLVFIPLTINNIGDGLAEPIGVHFGKHKYSTTALYYKGKFWNGNFVRSYEGSSCVFITTAVVVGIFKSTFPSSAAFWITITILPFLMTIAEAKAPHTNDGPFLALIGCGFLSVAYLL